MTSTLAQLLRVLPSVLFCLTLTGAADATASAGPVIGWGNPDGVTPPDAVNGVLGTAANISAGDDHSCAIQAGTNNVVCWGRDGYDQATPPDTVNGVAGTATNIAAGDNHTLALPEPSAWLAQLTGLALLCALQRSRTRKRRDLPL